MDALPGRRGQARPSRCGCRCGVVGAISPFNFPLNLVAHKIAPSLAAGCAVVLKPASQTPLVGAAPGGAGAEAGLPPGWLNVLVGPSAEIGDVLVEDERVAVLTFTGSSGVGWKLRERAPRKKVLLELGNATPRDRRAGRGRRGAAAAACAARVLVRRPELHLGPAHLRRARAPTTASSGSSCPGREPRGPATRRDDETDVGPRHRRRTPASASSPGSTRRGAEAPRSWPVASSRAT